MDRYPQPWRSEKIPGGYAVRDAAGTIVAHVFGRAEPWESRPGVLAPLTMDEAKEMALNIVKAGEVLSERLKANSPRQGSDQRPSPPRAGKMAKRSRFNAIPSPHSISAQPPIPWTVSA